MKLKVRRHSERSEVSSIFDYLTLQLDSSLRSERQAILASKIKTNTNKRGLQLEASFVCICGLDPQSESKA